MVYLKTGSTEQEIIDIDVEKINSIKIYYTKNKGFVNDTYVRTICKSDYPNEFKLITESLSMVQEALKCKLEHEKEIAELAEYKRLKEKYGDLKC